MVLLTSRGPNSLSVWHKRSCLLFSYSDFSIGCSLMPGLLRNNNLVLKWAPVDPFKYLGVKCLSSSVVTAIQGLVSHRVYFRISFGMAWVTCVYQLTMRVKQKGNDIFLVIADNAKYLPFGVQKNYTILHAEETCLILRDNGNATETKQVVTLRELSNGTMLNRTEQPICLLWVTSNSTAEQHTNCKSKLDALCKRTSYDYAEDDRKVCSNISELMTNVRHGCIMNFTSGGNE
ncbi:uncharacterized protein LOC125939989 isoform X2 [Dermacentor silvarum]|uniref:uncharacterized protein LOC125939989 isoform X2 n=2 Tax=Dermacentor silvarum TaxID=543639 RepID=UPI002101562D|nr:uncharacterized protein LOC125939989 isoform X2 [Dermacentor silvarum]